MTKLEQLEADLEVAKKAVADIRKAIRDEKKAAKKVQAAQERQELIDTAIEAIGETGDDPALIADEPKCVLVAVYEGVTGDACRKSWTKAKIMEHLGDWHFDRLQDPTANDVVPMVERAANSGNHLRCSRLLSNAVKVLDKTEWSKVKAAFCDATAGC